MSFPTLQVRPNEQNPKVLRAHEFLRQSNQLVERNLINTEGRKMLAKMLTKAVTEVKGIYALDEKRAELAKSGKLFVQLKSAHETSRSVMEDRFELADLARQVQEKKLDVQRNYYESDHLRKSVQQTNADIRREREMNDKRLENTIKASGELLSKSVSILNLLENSTDVCKLRKMEEQKKVISEEVETLRDEKKRLADDIRSKKATLKAEEKRPFQKAVIDCAKHYKLCQSLTPKLLNSKKSLEALRDEEESRRACGSLDETMQFDRSFVLASMDKDKSPEKRSQKSSSMSTSFNESISENHTIEEVVTSGPIKETPAIVPIPTPVPIAKPVPPPTPVQPPRKASFTPMAAPPTPVQPPRKASFTPVAAPPTPSQSLKRNECFMETQRAPPREPSPEPEPEKMEEEEQADKSMDVMEQGEEEEEEDEPMEQETQQETQKTVEQVVAPTASQSPKHGEVQEQGAPEVLNISNQGDNMHNDIAAWMNNDEAQSENGSNPSDNFSFNFFGKSGGEGNASGVDADSNFDFNFGGVGDEGSSNVSGGAFDLFNCGGDDGANSSNNNASDPFGFGAAMSGGSGGGDMSFNFNFDGDNDGEAGGAGGNSTSFFNNF